jgi:valyl-tRNA synthetase
LKVETKAKVPVELFVQEPEIRKLVDDNRGSLERLANVEGVRFTDTSLEKLPNVRHTARFDVRLVYEQKIDVAAEREKLKKELEKIEKELANIDRQLGNESFTTKAPAHVVDKLRQRREELIVLRAKIQNKLDELG